MEEQLCHYSSGAGTWELDQGTLCKAALSLSAEGLGERGGAGHISEEHGSEG